ncbi:hypothetical protein LZ554_000014 [Drepanopeziza brunnea f. sp. 'monogermtubi']|nr:hypothetical protein LZ554_000014 [Drepanopeziza brunnea f. sp. 'monogermtubi']
MQRLQTMRWSLKRLFATGFLATLVVLSLLWNRMEIPDYVPETVHDYFHSEDASTSTSTSTSTPANQSRVDVAQRILALPLWTYDESVEASTPSCPTKGVNFDVGPVRDNAQQWRDIPSSQIMKWRREIADYLQKKTEEKATAPKRGHGGRGIAMTAGDRNAVIRVRTSIRFLRSYNCTLPVEIFHFQSELSPADKELLSELQTSAEGSDLDGGAGNVTFRVVEGVQKGDGWKDFQIKGAAIQQSSFDEILYLDTDSILVADPESLFESKAWEETGLLLWPDYTKSHPTSPIWRLVGQPCRNEYEGESGQMVISRSRHQDLLLVVEYMALHHDEFYGFMGGDRESFRAAALLLGKQWGGPGRMLAAAGAEGVGHTMLQAGPDGQWMFVHANLIKHGMFPRPLWRQISRATQDRYAEGTTYGSIASPNDRIGEGVELRVQHESKLQTVMGTFEGYDDALVTVEDWDRYEELRGFEAKWERFGGVH